MFIALFAVIAIAVIAAMAFTAYLITYTLYHSASKRRMTAARTAYLARDRARERDAAWARRGMAYGASHIRGA